MFPQLLNLALQLKPSNIDTEAFKAALQEKCQNATPAEMAVYLQTLEQKLEEQKQKFAQKNSEIKQLQSVEEQERNSSEDLLEDLLTKL